VPGPRVSDLPSARLSMFVVLSTDGAGDPPGGPEGLRVLFPETDLNELARFCGRIREHQQTGADA